MDGWSLKSMGAHLGIACTESLNSIEACEGRKVYIVD